jgi:hypothetical protein
VREQRTGDFPRVKAPSYDRTALRPGIVHIGDTRLYFQHATKGEFTGTIEKILNRRVRAFAVEAFHLDPITSQR